MEQPTNICICINVFFLLPAEHRGNIVCELVQELARLVQNQSGAVAEAAATCLGDIGPIDLTSWTSSSQHNRGLNHDGYQLEQSRIYQSHPSQQKYFWIFYWLNQYLIDSWFVLIIFPHLILNIFSL